MDRTSCLIGKLYQATNDAATNGINRESSPHDSPTSTIQLDTDLRRGTDRVRPRMQLIHLSQNGLLGQELSIPECRLEL